jgi:hypothetical protein
MEMLQKEEDQAIKQEFMYPHSLEQLSGELLRNMINSYRIKSEKYAGIRISVKTGYGWQT